MSAADEPRASHPKGGTDGAPTPPRRAGVDPARIAMPLEWRVTDKTPVAVAGTREDGRALLVFDAAQVASGLILDAGRCVVGRSSRCDVWLQDAGVSRRHCQLRSDGGTVWLKDLDSTNGTFVNGRRIETRELVPGDVIGVGSSTLTLVRRDSPEWQAHRSLADLAYNDDLSGLLNRRGFRLRVDAAFAVRHAQNSLALLVIDADHFKAINDRFGHATGDRVIRQIANAVRALLPETAFAGRVGGEEFAVVLPQPAPDFARRLAETLRARIASSALSSVLGPVPVTVSIGIAQGKVASGARELFARADAALYRAKSGGRNRVCE